MDSTGNTQGMRFKIRPPNTANSSSVGRECSGSLLRLRQWCEARAGLDVGGAGAGEIRGNLDGNGVGLRAVLLGRHQHAADGAGFGRLIADLHRQIDGILGARQCLRRGVLDAALIVGKERQRVDLRTAWRPTRAPA